jgi:preprotein translocase subunit SecE
MATPVAPQPSLPTRATRFYHDVMAEMKRVTWPDRAQLQDSTIKIIIFVLALGAIIALLDLGLQFLLVQLPALLLGR